MLAARRVGGAAGRAGAEGAGAPAAAAASKGADAAAKAAAHAAGGAAAGEAAAGGPEAAEGEAEAEVDEAELAEELAKLTPPSLKDRLLTTATVGGYTVPVPKPGPLRWVAGGAGAVLASTFLWSVYVVVYRMMTPRAKRKAQVNKNLLVVETLDEYLPGRRSQLGRGTVRGLSGRTGFSPDLVFRKYMRYMMNERAFDEDALADLLALKEACALTPEQLEEVVSESAERTFKKTGILMRKPTGMTAQALEKKAIGRSTFAKLLYILERPEFLPAERRDAAVLKLMETFGATQEDTEELRIASLATDAENMDTMERMFSAAAEPATVAATAEAPAAEAPAPAAAAEEPPAEKQDAPATPPPPPQSPPPPPTPPPRAA